MEVGTGRIPCIALTTDDFAGLHILADRDSYGGKVAIIRHETIAVVNGNDVTITSK